MTKLKFLFFNDRNNREEHKTIQASIDNTKKFVLKELETSDKLREFKDRLSRDISNIERQVHLLEAESIKLDQQIDHFALILEKTGVDLEQSRSEGLLTKNHVTKLVNKLDKLSREKFDIEEKILELLQEQITTDKAGQHRGRLLRDAQEERRKLEILISQNENQLSNIILDLEKWRGNVQHAKDKVEKLKNDHDDVESEANSVNDEIEKLKSATKSKLIQLDLLHKELEKLIDQMGGREVNLKEAEIVDLEKRINEVDTKIKESQQFWLKTQSAVNSLSERRAQQMDEIFVGRKQILVIEQKALKVQNELESSEQEQREIQRTLSNLNVKLDQVSKKLYEKQKIHEKEENECEMAHLETVESLKSAEMNVLELEQCLIDFGKEIEELKDEVRDKHYETLSWETKFKLAQETKKMKDDEMAQNSEIGFMKAEIHRMEVKLSSLKKLQERMVQALEHSVHHRDHIYDAALVREKKTGSKIKTQTNVKHKLNEMQNKLKFLCGELTVTQRQLRDFEKRKVEIHEEIIAKEQDIQTENMQDCLLQTEIEQSILLKQHNLENIVRRQKRARRYRALQTCNYLPKLKTDAAMDTELLRQAEIHENLVGILDSLQQDFPEHKFAVEKIFQTLKE
jgi:coiled-coil domain-containing protein 40